MSIGSSESAALAQKSDLAVIGGSGLYSLLHDSKPRTHKVVTPYAEEPVTLYLEATPSGPVWFLPRHGQTHAIAPHRINYRANLWSLQQLGVTQVIAVNAVGGIAAALAPGALVLPDQIIDYSWGREHTFSAPPHVMNSHIDFTWPYAERLCDKLMRAASNVSMVLQRGGVYACTQGPRLETAAEIRKLQRDGCDMVGMTGMPEAALARELNLDYACVALVVNRAAGLADGLITMEQITLELEQGIAQIRKLLLETVAVLRGQQD